jgi:hypothetical protein
MADDELGLLLARPPCPDPLIVVSDNASFHRGLESQEALPALWARGIYLDYLPPYNPELNEATCLFRQVKHHRLPERVYMPVATSGEVIDAACSRCDEVVFAQHRIEARQLLSLDYAR